VEISEEGVFASEGLADLIQPPWLDKASLKRIKHSRKMGNGLEYTGFLGFQEDLPKTSLGGLRNSTLRTCG
jgi:hypothetical protein